MALVWQYGEKSGYQAWKGLSWGMVSFIVFYFYFISIAMASYLIVVGSSTWWGILCMHMAFLL